ncbi:uncharacterized protein BXZ73DRAFT_38036 [Epithele typhae]|uniref:uncharacterized protein n=1 Tax=Epithele typhae TaxID=378194 RepID=UPI002007A565|nr:uncharacterized protein BXZ73DRAFT_38036 [Epithele typhae]KAH9945292.1 hypothetical protein BXZ73DRAFT_38036 [Epithele typhae]
MRLFGFVGLFVGSLALIQSVLASPVDGEPEVVAAAHFPESNAFGHVVNGERNTIIVNVENKDAERNVTLKNVAGSIHYADSGKLLKNFTHSNFGFPLHENTPLQLPFMFYSEFKPGDYRLNVWVEHSVDGQTYRVMAYDSIVTVVEPESSFFDFKALTTYGMVLAILGGAGYYTYLTLAPQPKKRKSAAAQVSAPVGPVTATGAGGYQEEWIPEHHLKKTTRKGKSGGMTSGDETSGVESGAEGRKRKGRK